MKWWQLLLFSGFHWPRIPLCYKLLVGMKKEWGFFGFLVTEKQKRKKRKMGQTVRETAAHCLQSKTSLWMLVVQFQVMKVHIRHRASASLDRNLNFRRFPGVFLSNWQGRKWWAKLGQVSWLWVSTHTAAAELHCKGAWTISSWIWWARRSDSCQHGRRLSRSNWICFKIIHRVSIR